MVVCEYCKKEFASKYTLKTHQTKQKSCLGIQGKSFEDIFTCSCNKKFNLKLSYDRHLSICKHNKVEELETKVEELETKVEELEKENIVVKTTFEKENIVVKTTFEIRINELEKEILVLKTKLEERHEFSKEKNTFIQGVISKPTTQNNITQNNVNITPMYTQEQYAEIAREKFTIQHFNKGARGVSNFIGETIPQEMLSFSDMSRNVLSYKDATPSIIEPATSIYNKIQEDIANEPPSPVNSESDNELEERKSKKQLKLEKAEKNMNDISKLGKRKVARTTIVDGLKLSFNRKASFNVIES